MARGFLLTRNALDPTDATVRKDYTTATPGTVTGKPGGNLVLEPVGATTAFASAAPEDNGVLVRLGDIRLAGAAAVLGHNLGPHDCWRLAAGTDERPAQRPVWTTDGVDDRASTSEAIPDAADLTILAAMRLPPQGVSQETAECSLIRLRTAAAGDRARLTLRSGTVGTPYALKLRFPNFSGTVEINQTIYAEGDWVRVGIRYIDDVGGGIFSLWWNGVKLAENTASAAWADNGDTALYLASSPTPSEFAAVEWMAVAIYAEDLSDAAMAAWTGDIMEGNEVHLAFGCNFTAGTGAVGTDVTGNANLTLTGGTWAQRVSPYALHSEDRAAWGPWSSRQGVKLATTTAIASPAISAAPRSVTLAFSFQWPADSPEVSSAAGPFVGPAWSTALLRAEFTPTGSVLIRSQRGAAVTVTSSTNCKDGIVRHVRAVMDGHAKTLTLYIAAAGSVEVSEGTPQTIGAHATLASCKLGVGDGSTTQPGVIISDVRAYSRVALEADAPMGSDAAAWQLTSMWAHIRLDGQVVDGVDVTRTYTGTSGLTYQRMYRTDDHGALEAADARRHASGDDPYRSYPRRLLADFGSNLAISELYLQVDRRDGDGDATDGYAELGTLYAPYTVRPPDGLLTDGRRQPSVSVPATRTPLGAVYSAEGYAADAVSVEVIRHAGRVTPVPTTVTAEEVEREVFALPDWASRLRGVWLDPGVDAHRFVEQVGVGYLSGNTSSREVRDVAFDRWQIEIIGVWPLIS